MNMAVLDNSPSHKSTASSTVDGQWAKRKRKAGEESEQRMGGAERWISDGGGPAPPRARAERCDGAEGAPRARRAEIGATRAGR